MPAAVVEGSGQSLDHVGALGIVPARPYPVGEERGQGGPLRGGEEVDVAAQQLERLGGGRPGFGGSVPRQPQGDAGPGGVGGELLVHLGDERPGGVHPLAQVGSHLGEQVALDDVALLLRQGRAPALHLFGQHPLELGGPHELAAEAGDAQGEPVAGVEVRVEVGGQARPQGGEGGVQPVGDGVLGPLVDLDVAQPVEHDPGQGEPGGHLAEVAVAVDGAHGQDRKLRRRQPALCIEGLGPLALACRPLLLGALQARPGLGQPVTSGVALGVEVAVLVGGGAELVLEGTLAGEHGFHVGAHRPPQLVGLATGGAGLAQRPGRFLGACLGAASCACRPRLQRQRGRHGLVGLAHRRHRPRQQDPVVAHEVDGVVDGAGAAPGQLLGRRQGIELGGGGGPGLFEGAVGQCQRVARLGQLGVGTPRRLDGVAETGRGGKALAGLDSAGLEVVQAGGVGVQLRQPAVELAYLPGELGDAPGPGGGTRGRAHVARFRLEPAAVQGPVGPTAVEGDPAAGARPRAAPDGRQRGGDGVGGDRPALGGDEPRAHPAAGGRLAAGGRPADHGVAGVR